MCVVSIAGISRLRTTCTRIAGIPLYRHQTHHQRHYRWNHYSHQLPPPRAVKVCTILPMKILEFAPLAALTTASPNTNCVCSSSNSDSQKYNIKPPAPPPAASNDCYYRHRHRRQQQLKYLLFHYHENVIHPEEVKA